jgi:hypothetical protein
VPRHRVLRTLSLLLLAAACTDDQPTLPAMSARPPAAPLHGFGITHVWTGDVSTDWGDPQNWNTFTSPAVIDTAYVPLSAAQYPVLTANESVGGVTVENGATLTLGAFDLTAYGDVTAGLTGGITGTTGRLILGGTARTVRGRLPRMRVTGSYSLSGIVTARSPVDVTAGRLTDTNWRIDALSF